VQLRRVRGLVYSVLGGASMSLQEVSEIGERLAAVLEPDAQVIFGAQVDPALGEELVVTLIATGFEPPPPPPPSVAATQPLDLFSFRPARPPSKDEYEEYLERRLADYGAALGAASSRSRVHARASSEESMYEMHPWMASCDGELAELTGRRTSRPTGVVGPRDSDGRYLVKLGDAEPELLPEALVKHLLLDAQ